jgi:hypothetical protein
VLVSPELSGATNGFLGSPTGLSIFWLEVLELAHAGDDASVSRKLATLALRREDVDDLFGEGAAGRLWQEYAQSFRAFASEGAREIAHKIRERRFDDVEVEPLPHDHADALRTNVPVYSVRLKRGDGTDGLRIDRFVYLDGAWRTGLKIARRG